YGWGQGFQLSMTEDMRPQLFACKHCDGSQKVTAPNALELNTWTHLAVTMENGTAKLYVDGVLVETGTGIVTEFNRLQVGVNRFGQEPWKGYVDELMVFGDTLSDEDIANVYKNTLPGTPQNATATNWVGDTVVVGWDAVDGINEYNVYYSTGGTVDANSPYITVTGGTVVNFDNLTAGQDYTYAVAGVSPLGVGELSDPTTVTVDYASVDAEIAARFTATGAEELTDLVTHTYNADGYANLLPVFPDDLWRMVGTDNVTHTYETLSNNTTVAMAPNPAAGNDYRYRYADFRFTIDYFGQYQQNLYADFIGKPECRDKDFRTLVSWMGCVGVDFVDRHTGFLHSRLGYTDRRSILPYTTLGAYGVWQLQFKHHWWGWAWYTIIR
ncbi:MAG: LamG-like jellyroll fold domain-containing protein, partial [bacterium]